MKKSLILVIILLTSYLTILGVQLFLQIETHLDFYRVDKNLNLFNISIWLVWIILVAGSTFYRIKFHDPVFFNFTYIFLVMSFGTLAILNHLASTIYTSSITRNELFSLGLFSAIHHLVASLVLTAFLNIGIRIYQSK